ncbi:TM0106 family RecB-like putative nuclease [Roseivirga echinicomitans]
MDFKRLTASKLQNHLACKRITYLDLLVENGDLQKPEWNNPSASILQELGNEHERKYLDFLKGKSLFIKELAKEDSYDDAILAMKAGYDIIAQPKLKWGKWMGYADILVKRNGVSELGDYYYEAQDTKLSQITKANTIVQLSLYSKMINLIQGDHAQVIGVVKPGDPFNLEEFNLSEFDAYFRYIVARFEGELKIGVEEQYPLPVEKCATCIWWKSCRAKWLKDDHLSLVAGLQNTHLKTLNGQGTQTLEGYAKEPTSVKEKPKYGSRETYSKLHSQSRVQLIGRNLETYVEVHPEWWQKQSDEDPNRGLNRLPVPNLGDIYFDFEGDHFYPNGGLEYLFGYLLKIPGQDDYEYHKTWALNRDEERNAFIAFMKFLMGHWESHPGFHIYHYAPYEPAALVRLASRHAIFEEDVDRLLRGQKFIDLHRVIKESLQAAVEQYSLKDLEKFAGMERQLDLQTASEARRKLGAALNLNSIHRITCEDENAIEEYNMDDCEATRKLHLWLEVMFQSYIPLGKVQRPELQEGNPTESIKERDQYIQQLFDQLEGLLPAEIASDEYKAIWLLMHTLGYFRREERIKYFEQYRISKLQPEELMDEKSAITYLKYEGVIPAEGRQRDPAYRFTFDPQELSSDFKRSGARVSALEAKFEGSVRRIDEEVGFIDIASKSELQDFTSIQLNNVISMKKLEDALHSYASIIIENKGFTSDDSLNARHDLLFRKTPKIGDVTLSEIKRGKESVLKFAIHCALNLNNSILPIQGPPGTGKTYLGGLMILELIKQGKKVGVTAIGHKTIQNLITKVKHHGINDNFEIDAVHCNKGDMMDVPEDYIVEKNEGKAIQAIHEGKLIGGTSYFWSSKEMGQELDYLFIDEAGQMSLAQVMAAARCAKNLILLGDPQQLQQPQQGAHPEGADASALDHLLNGLDTIPETKGIFLDTTWRLHPTISKFTSDLYYEGRLNSVHGTENQKVHGLNNVSGSGLYYMPVEHEGNQNRSDEEVSVISKLIDELLSTKTTWTDREGEIRLVTKQDIKVVAPYNIQVNALKKMLPEGVQVGTVDKFQGQEAPVVIYSMTSSTPEDAPRGMGFLYDPHRLNVATSRAQCVCIMVASPKLFEPDCHSVDQMRWANGMCLYKEMAKEL